MSCSVIVGLVLKRENQIAEMSWKLEEIREMIKNLLRNSPTKRVGILAERDLVRLQYKRHLLTTVIKIYKEQIENIYFANYKF